MNSKSHLSKKDIILTIIATGIIILGIYLDNKGNDFSNINISKIIEHLILYFLAINGLFQVAMFCQMPWLVPDFYGKCQKEKIDDLLQTYFKNEKDFLQLYSDEKTSFIMSQLDITPVQFNKIRLDLVNMRSIPKENVKEKINLLLKDNNTKIVINLEKDREKYSYDNVNLKYYINFNDIMFMHGYADEIATALKTFILKDFSEISIELSTINKVVIPHDGNFILGMKVGELLGKAVVKMRKVEGKVIKEQPWDGPLDKTDHVIIVHDVLATAEQIEHAITNLPKSCSKVAVYCLIRRTDCNNSSKLKNIRVAHILELNDEEVDNIINEK